MDLKEFYNKARSLTPGTEVEHRGYTLRKIDLGTARSPDHSEVSIHNRDGTKVEVFTLNAFDTFQEFSHDLDEVISYDPDSVSDWLNRE